MNELAQIGKKRTISISISILLISLHTIYLYQSNQPEIDSGKLVQQFIRFGLTIGLLILMYKGIKWARIVGIILFSLSVVLALISVFAIKTSTVSVIPLFVMIFIYGIAIHHFAISIAYKAFFNHQNSNGVTF
ncbi:MAG: hypothetical protein GQ574_18340 [Crocinitomix sp.]|nr:hypothetical protein [Crocinitomix sp.]